MWLFYSILSVLELWCIGTALLWSTLENSDLSSSRLNTSHKSQKVPLSQTSAMIQNLTNFSNTIQIGFWWGAEDQVLKQSVEFQKTIYTLFWLWIWYYLYLTVSRFQRQVANRILGLQNTPWSGGTKKHKHKLF